VVVKTVLTAIMLTLIFCLAMQARAEARHLRHGHHARPLDGNGNIIGGQPAGCPHAYCGCGLRKYLGIEDVRLNLASAWGRLFRHVSPAPQMVAVRKGGGHVMQLVAPLGGMTWLVRDYNSGHHLSRIHARSIAGFYFVDPRSRVASGD
jgi:hypothetical protein